MPAYLTTETKYNRPERVLDLHRFAADLCKALGGKMIPPVKGEAKNERWTSMEIGDAIIGLTKSWKQSEVEKVSVSISPRGLSLGYNDTPRGPEYALPSATVSTARPLASIAADIKRRVIDAAAAPMAKLREHAAACNQQRDDLQTVAADLRKRHPLLAVTVKDGERFSASLYRNSNDEPYLSGTVRSDGSVSIDRLGGLTAEQFERVMTALYPKKGSK